MDGSGARCYNYPYIKGPGGWVRRVWKEAAPQT